VPGFKIARTITPRLAGRFAIFIATVLAPLTLAAPPLRVVVVCETGASCVAFSERLRGQTSDLEIEILDAERSLPSLPIEASIAAVDEIARSSGSAVAVWWARGSIVALLREPAPGRVLVRAVAANEVTRDWQPDSADLEAGSLIARTAIIAAIEGKPIGEPRKPDPPVPPSIPPATPWKFSLGVGASLHWDDVPPSQGEGLELRVATKRGRFRFAGQWTERLTEDLDLPYAKGTLKGRLLIALVGFEPIVRPAFTLGVEARVGRLVSTIESSTGAYRDPVEFTRTTVGFGVRFHYVLLPNKVSLWAAANLDHVQDPIIIGVRDAGGFRPIWPMAANQPSMGFGIEYLLPFEL
jgi:hypothetical protein